MDRLCAYEVRSQIQEIQGDIERLSKQQRAHMGEEVTADDVLRVLEKLVALAAFREVNP